MKRVVFGEVYGKKRRAETRKQNGSRRLVVPEVPNDGWNLNAEQVTKIIKRKKKLERTFDRIANFWWKKATILHKEIATCFQATAQLEDLQFPLWFSEGKTTLIPKPGEFRGDNQRPITRLNNLYKWYTSCLLAQANQHIETYGLIQREQRGARGNCSGTVVHSLTSILNEKEILSLNKIHLTVKIKTIFC